MFYFGSLLVLHIFGLVKTQEWTKLNCPAPRAPLNGISLIFDDGLKVQYRCHPGFIMRGKPLLVCVNNKWDSPPPSCIQGRTYEDSMPTSNKASVSPFRNRFNWESGGSEPHHISIKYGNGSNRLPLINGLWKHPSPHKDSRVLSIVPDSSLGHSVPPEQLLVQELDIAALRHKVEQEVKSSRQINDKIDPEKNSKISHYPPLYANSDGFVLGVSNSNHHPVYHLGAIADTNRNSYHTARYLEPEMVELRRKQIEETRNIQMNAAKKRQQNKFNNIVTYSSRDIPVWQGRIKPQNMYQKGKTVYKSTRVESSGHIDQDRLDLGLRRFTTTPFDTRTVIYPKPQFIQMNKQKPTSMSFDLRTAIYPNSQSIKINKQNIPTEIPNIMKINTIPLLTEDVVIATIPTPINKLFTPEKTKNTTTRLPQIFTHDSYNKKHELKVVNNQEHFEWPPEALWFKERTTPKYHVTRRISTTQTLKRTKSTNKKSSRGSSQSKNRRKSQNLPIVTFSHGRVKSTNPKKTK